MSADLSALLRDWPFEPGKITVRLISGDDGEPKIQLRLDLGVMQMEVDGRPDGRRLENFESVLEQQEARLDDYVGEHGSASGFVLGEEECRLLREEALQYHHRSVCLMVLEDYAGVVRDATRNLRALDLCSKYAETEQDRQGFEHLRPYITMMRSRALASQALNDNEPKLAMLAIDEGLGALRQYFADMGQADLFEQSSEVQALRGMRSALTPKLPVSQSAELRQRLKQALETENFELAAILRDELRLLGD